MDQPKSNVGWWQIIQTSHLKNNWYLSYCAPMQIHCNRRCRRKLKKCWKNLMQKKWKWNNHLMSLQQWLQLTWLSSNTFGTGRLSRLSCIWCRPSLSIVCLFFGNCLGSFLSIQKQGIQKITGTMLPKHLANFHVAKLKRKQLWQIVSGMNLTFVQLLDAKLNDSHSVCLVDLKIFRTTAFRYEEHLSSLCIWLNSRSLFFRQAQNWWEKARSEVTPGIWNKACMVHLWCISQFELLQNCMDIIDLAPSSIHIVISRSIWLSFTLSSWDQGLGFPLCLMEGIEVGPMSFSTPWATV